ncbi:MAG: hypothetical protein E6G58_00095 [Actinobacteria bacterium]|nr:MAG: hypothetical protein E6G58_00095 [Actinomycetota bacterium]
MAALGLRAAGTALAVVLILLVMLWFTWGTQENIARGNRLLRWLQTGLPLIGRRTTLRWVGSSAVELAFVDPVQPFADVTVVVVLEPRDVPWFWALARSHGRKDFLIFRARLRSPPRFELEIGDASGWTGSERIGRLDEDAWAAADWQVPGLRVFHATGGSSPEAVRPILHRLTEASGGVWRLSVRREPPHVEVHVLPPDPEAADANELVRAVVDLAGTAAS